MDMQSRNLLVPRGKIFFAKYKPGTQVPGPMREFGNCPEFTLTRTSNKLPHYSSQGGMRVLDEEITIEATLSGAVTTDDCKAENLALWFMSSSETISTTAQTALVETFETVKVGDSFQLGRSDANPSGYRKITTVLVTDGAAGSPVSLVLNTDYTVEAELGIVTMLTEQAKVEITYDVAVSTRTQIAAGETEVEGELKFISFNPLGEQGDITIPRARIAPNGDMPLLNDPDNTAFLTLPLSISVLRKGSQALAYRDTRPVA